MPSPTKTSVSRLPMLLIASLVLPPVGIVMWWLRPWRGGWARRGFGFLGRTAVSVLLVALTVTYLVKADILYTELSGAGWKPIFSLHKPEQDMEALEKHRAAQLGQEPPAVPATATVSAPASEPATAVSPRAHAELGKSQPLKTAVTPPAAVGPSWTDFRGPGRAGSYIGGSILTDWPGDGLKMLLRQHRPGADRSSPRPGEFSAACGETGA